MSEIKVFYTAQVLHLMSNLGGGFPINQSNAKLSDDLFHHLLCLVKTTALEEIPNHQVDFMEANIWGGAVI